jgi:hypothetical protein
MSQSETQLRDEWSLMNVAAPEGAAIFRVRTDKPDDPRIAEFATCVRIQWPYEGEVGLPSKADAEWMDLFESRLVDLIYGEGLSYLMLVTTGFNVKEWLFYTTGHEAFMQRFNDLVADLPRFPLEIAFIADPQWEQWESIAQHALAAESGDE